MVTVPVYSTHKSEINGDCPRLLRLPTTGVPVPVSPSVPVSPYGATTLLDASDALPVPTEFVAVTVKVYEVVGVRPVTVANVPLVVAVILPGLEVTVCKIIR